MLTYSKPPSGTAAVLLTALRLTGRPYGCILLALICMLFSNAVGQQEADAAEKPAKPVMIDLTQGATFEIAPHTGAMGGSGLFGIKASMNYSNINLEASVEQVIGQAANLYPIALNFLLNLSTKGRLLPYGTVGGGLYVTVPTNSIGSETVSSMGANFGGGARFYLTPSFGLRVEAKQHITSIINELDDRDELLIFQEFSIGVTFMFR